MLSLFKKISIMLSIFSVLTVQAYVPTPQLQKLEKAYSDLSFSLEVEWDQQDEEFFKAQVNKFEQTVVEAMNKGVTKEELIIFLQQNIRNQNIAHNVRDVFTTLDAKQMNEDEILNFVDEYVSENTNARGANWIGGSVVSTAIKATVAIGVISLIIYAVEENYNSPRSNRT